MLVGSIILLTTTVTFLVASVAGHILTTPLITGFDVTAVQGSLVDLALAAFIAVFVWVTPFVIWEFITPLPRVRTDYRGLPRFELWGVAAVFPAVLIAMFLWSTPAWSTVVQTVPGIAESFNQDTLTNAATFLLIAVPSVLSFLTMTRDKIRSEHNGHYQRTYTDAHFEPVQPTTQSSTSTDSTQQDTDTATESESMSSPATREDDNSEDGMDSVSRAGMSTTGFGSEFEYDWQEPPSITFADVGGMDSVKSELTSEIITPLTGDTEKYKAFGVGIPNILLHGPPGTGKTYIAKALAGELEYPYVKLSASEITSEWINKSGQRVSQLFDEAAQIGNEHGYAVIFIDEIDALLTARDQGQQHGEDQKVVNEFLNHLAETGEQNTLFVGATNFLEQLDDAATRAGRIDKKVHVGLPDMDARVGILHVHLSQRPGRVPENRELRRIARLLDGKTAADIEQVVDAAARHAIERDGERVTVRDLETVVE